MYGIPKDYKTIEEKYSSNLTFYLTFAVQQKFCKLNHFISILYLQVIPKVTQIIKEEMRFNRSEEYEYSIMVTGIPNVGKSSLINAMRRLNVKRGKLKSVYLLHIL